ncbi:hypothetical protein JAAARDRAFT_62307 [Jaapia argillacea MUCL 33604]|uniref:Uncharacterized protein n=1 Tax=Jaapia argillacea MUCL 33604 TaxID=933084 RepID=A0A067PA34_9AGAM|nr:hypothetical protein JAAARDRAFT_62307 [Jaapia argillacea MUCL 33604]
MVLVACKNDIIALWEDKAVKSVLKKQGVRLEDMPGFFLNDVERIATCREHHFVMESGLSHPLSFSLPVANESDRHRYRGRVVCVRRGRKSGNVQAIIFLAPLLFNQTLEEAPSVNRVEDSLYPWKEICTNPILAKVKLVLYLNKIDILQAILDAGVQLKKFVSSFGDNPNDVEHVVKFFRDKFRSYHERFSLRPSPKYVG